MYAYGGHWGHKSSILCTNGIFLFPFFFFQHTSPLFLLLFSSLLDIPFEAKGGLRSAIFLMASLHAAFMEGVFFYLSFFSFLFFPPSNLECSKFASFLSAFLPFLPFYPFGGRTVPLRKKGGGGKGVTSGPAALLDFFRLPA